MRTMLKYLKPVRLRIAVGMTIKFLGSIMELLLPYLLAYLLDTVVPEAKKSAHTDKIFLYMGIMVLCSALALVFNIIANRMAASTTRDAVRQIRMDLFDRTLRLSDSKINEYSIPTLEMRLTGDTYNIHRMLGMLQRMGIRAPILLLGGLALTTFMEPVLTLVLVALLPLVAIVVITVSKKGVPLYSVLQQKTDDMVRVVRENITGIRVVKALSKTEYEKERFADINKTVSDSETKAGVTMALTNPIMTFLLNGGLALVILVGAYRVNAGVGQVGKIIAFMSYFTIILNAMMSISRMFVVLSKGAASARRISNVLECADETSELPFVPNDEHREEMLVFEDVCFSYNGNKNNLEHISFALPKGGTLGIIGATGSGKSTLTKLLMRFYDPDHGHIYIDGREARSIPLSELRQKFGVAMQNDFLYADTIADNISFERGLDEEALRRAVRCAQAEEFVSERGLDSMLTVSGHNLSGGQKQRLLVSRAVAGNPEILLLDDSSSALDYKTDAQMRAEIFSMQPRPTTVIVAQRVSSVMCSDVILVLEDGKCVASGSHDELMKNCDIYREIARTQMGGEADE